MVLKIRWKGFSSQLMLLLLLVTPLRSDIFVDFTISHGGNELGTFRAALYYEEVPRVVANFIGLGTGDLPWLDPETNRVREGAPYYDGLLFHRLEHDFVLQGGDPLGNGMGGPGYVFQDQFHPDLTHDGPYYLSMANSGPNSNGSQFFITLDQASFLDNLHSVFGKVVDGTEIIDAINNPDNFPTDADGFPEVPIVIESIAFSGSGLEDFRTSLDEHGLPRWRTVQVELQVNFEGDPSSHEVFLDWHREAYWDYPVTGSANLQDWDRLGFLLSMDEDPDFSVEASGVYSASRGFFQVYAVDYSALPVIPQSMLAPGTTLVLPIPGGVLTLFPDGENQGSWVFDEDGGGQLSGVFDEVENVLWEDLSEVVPDEGAFISTEGSYARLLPVRTITAFFGEPIGSWGITAIQPTLSFHGDGHGWYDGPVNANAQPPAPFRDTFTVTFPMDP